MEKVYKAVRNFGYGKLYSVYIDDSYSKLRKNLQLNYAKGQITLPIGSSKIFAFCSIEKAIKWMCDTGRFSRNPSHVLDLSTAEDYGFELWLAETSKAECITEFKIPDTVSQIYYDFDDVWNCHRHDISWNSAPEGTVLCPDLKLIKRVK